MESNRNSASVNEEEPKYTGIKIVVGVLGFLIIVGLTVITWGLISKYGGDDKQDVTAVTPKSTEEELPFNTQISVDNSHKIISMDDDQLIVSDSGGRRIRSFSTTTGELNGIFTFVREK